MAYGNRSNTVIGQSSLLSFQFLKNNLGYKAHSVIKVNVHDTYSEAQNDTDIKQTIAGNKVSHVTTGLYNYKVKEQLAANTYFDKIFIKPESDTTTLLTFINPFYVRKESYGGTAPGDVEKAKIYVNLFDAVGNAKAGSKAYVEMNEDYAYYGKTLIQNEREMFCVSKSGVIEMYLTETETMSLDTGKDIYYTVTIEGTDFCKKFQIAKGLLEEDLLDIPSYVP
jgi:hypothetical protein